MQIYSSRVWWKLSILSMLLHNKVSFIAGLRWFSRSFIILKVLQHHALAVPKRANRVGELSCSYQLNMATTLTSRQIKRSAYYPFMEQVTTAPHSFTGTNRKIASFACLISSRGWRNFVVTEEISTTIDHIFRYLIC